MINKIARRAVRVVPDIFMRGAAAVLTVFALFGFNPQALAATDTWVGADTGGSPTTDWVNADNWAADAQPASGDSLVFTSTNGQSTTTLTDSLTSATFLINGIVFNSGAVAYTLTGNPFELGATITNNSANTETINNPITLSANHTFTSNPSGGNLTFGGVISGASAGITVSGGGTVTLDNANSYTGTTTLADGSTLALNFGAVGAPATNIISPSSALSLSGGTLTANLGGSQTFATTTLNNGFDVISATGNSTVNLGTTFTYEPGGTLEFIGPEYDSSVTTTAGQANGGDVTATGVITTPASVSGNANTALRGSSTDITDGSTAADEAAFGEVGLYDFAIMSPSSPYTIIGASQGTGGLAGSNGGGGSSNDGAYNLLNGTNFNSNYANGGLFDVLGTDTAHNTDNLEGVRFNANASATVAGSADFSVGGFLVTPNVGAFNDFITVDLQTGARTTDLGSTVFFQNNNLGFLDIQAVLQNNSNTGDPQGGSYVQSGAGTVSYQGVNTYTGQAYLNGGVSEITADSAFGALATAAAVNLNGGTIFGSVTMSLDNAGANPRPITLYSAGGGLAELTALTFTVDGLITGGAGTGPLIIGIPASAANGNTLGLVPGTGTIDGTATANTAQFAAGTVVVTDASNTYTGGTLLESGVLRLNTNTLGTTTGVFGGTTNGGPITLNGGTFQWGAGITADISAQGLVVGSLGGILDSNGNNVTMTNPIRGTGTLTVANSTGSGSVNLSANDSIFNGSVAVNSGNLIISGTKTYTGTTSINGGTLTLAVGGSLGNTAVTDFNSGTIAAALSGNQNFNIGTTGATLQLNGGSTLSLQAVDVDTLDTLTLNSVAATGTGTVLTVGAANAANIDFDINSVGSDELVVNDGLTAFGASGGKIFIADLDTSTPLPSYTLVSDPSGGLLAGGSSAGPDFWLGTTGLSLGGLNYGLSLTTTGTSIVLNFTVNNPNFYWTGATNGSWATSSNFAANASGATPQSGSFSASSNVFLTANSASNYAQTLDGNYTINSLSFTGTGTGAGSNSITLASGTGTALTINAGNSFVDSNGNNYAAGTGLVVQPGAAAHTISANVNLGNSQVWNINNSGTTPLTVTGVIADAVAGDGDSLTKTGTGTLILSAAETYDGGTIVSAGTVRLGPGGSLLPTGKLTVNGGRINLNGNSQTVGGLSDGGVSTGIITSATGTSVLTVNDNSAAIYSGTITDNNANNGASLALVLSGSASETISGSNNYTGGTTVTNGTLVAANNYALGNNTSANGGLLLNPTGTAKVAFTSSNPNIASLASSGAGTSSVVLGSTSNGGTPTILTVGGGGSTTVFNGVISDQPEGNTNAFGSLVVDGGSLTLGGANTFTGTTVISGGALIIGNPLALQFSTVNYNNQGGVLSFGSQTAVTLGGLEGAQSLPFVNTNAAAVALTLGNNPNVNDVYSGNLSDSGLGSSVIVAGGTITLAGTDAYTGTTTVNAGTLAISGAVGSSATPSGAVTIDGGISSVLTVSGTLYAPSISQSNVGTINLTAGLISLSGAFTLSTGNAGTDFANLTGGTLITNSLAINRDNTNFGAAAPAAGSTTEGLYVDGATVNIATTLADGNGGTGDASSNNVRMDAGSITVGGVTTITNDAGSRFTLLDINGGVFTDNDTSGIGIQVGGNADTGLDAELLVRNGILNTPAITLGNTSDNGGILEFQDIGGTTNIGAGGIVSTAPAPTVVNVVVGSTSAATAPIIAASASWSSSLPMTLSNSGGVAPTFLTSGGNISLSGTLSGSGGLTLSGTGALTLSGANSYTGTTTINGGTLKAASATALGTASAITFGGGTLQFSALDTTDYSAVIVNSTGAVSVDTNGQNILFAAPFAASDTGGLTVIDSAGGGSLTLTSSNSYSAPTTIGASGHLILSSTGASVAALGNTAISVASGGTFAVKPNSGNIQIGSTGASLSLAAGASFTMADGTVGALTVNGNGSPSTLNLGGTVSSPDNLTFDLGTTGADQLIINNGGVSFAASSPQSDIFLDAVNAPSSLTGIPILVAPDGALSLSDFSLSTLFVSFGGSIYTASLSLGDSNTELLVNFVQGSPTTYYFTGAQSSSWSNINNFATDHTGAFPQSSGSLGSLADVFLTDDNPNAGNFATETLDGNYTINALSFTGTGTGAGNTSITLASSSGATAYTLTLNAASSFSDTNGNSYPTGTGLVVQPGSAAQTISANVDLGASQTWEINNSASNPLTVGGVIADAPSTTHDALTISGSGELIFTNANTYDGGTTVSGGTLMLGAGGSISSTGVLTVNGAGTFDLGGNSQTVGGLSDGGVSTGIITTSTGSATLTVNNTGPEAFSGTITDNNNVNGASLALYLAGPANNILSGSNSFTGGTTLAAGNLTVANNYGLGLATSASANAGLTFNNTATTNVFFTSANPQVASINNGTLQTGAANVILGNASGAGSSTTLNLGAGGAAQNPGDTFAGTISDLSGTISTAFGNLAIVGGAFVDLTGVNTFIGTTVVSGSGAFGASLLELGNADALENSTLNYNNQGGTISFGTLTTAALGGLSGSQSLSIPVALTIGNDNVSSLYTGMLNGAGSIIKTGTGTVQFGSGTNGGASYAGSTSVVSGTLIVGGNSNLVGTVDLTAVPAVAGGVGLPNGLIVQDNAVINAASELFLSSNDGGNSANYAGPSTLTISGTASVTAPSLSIGHVSRVETGDFITISGSGSLIVNGNIALLSTEGGTASTTSINLNGGVLQADSFSLAQGSDPAGQLVNFYFNGGILQAGASDNPPTTTFLPLLTGLTAEVMAGGAIINTNGFNITFAQPLVSGTTAPDGGLTKIGGGILTLGTADTYTGPTTINGGELALPNINSIEDTSGITFSGTGALRYTGSNTKDYSNKILNSTAPIAIDTNGQNITYASSIVSSNIGGLTVENSTPNVGGLTITAAEAYSGPTVVQSGAELILGVSGATPAGSNVTVSGSLQALTNNDGVGGNLSLGSGSTLSTVDGAIGTVAIAGNLSIGGATAANIDLELNTEAGTNDSITVSGSNGLVFGAGGGGVINVTDINPSGVQANQYILLTDNAGLGNDNFSLGESSLLVDGTNYLLSLGETGGTQEVLNLTAASLNFYFTGLHGTSWNNIQSFATDSTGTVPQVSTSTLTAASNVFLTATSNVVNAPKTIDGNDTINSLSFTSAASGITLASGTATAALTIAAQGAFADASGNVYNAGTGIIVQSGAGANTINSGIALGNSQTWEINNSSSNPLTINGVVEDGTNGIPNALTKSGPGTLVLNNAETYSGGTIVTGGTLALGVSASASLESTAGLTVTGTGTFDLTGHTQLVSSLSDGGVSTGVITSSTGAATLTIDNSTPSSYSGAITDNNSVNGASLALLLEGSSNVTLSGSSTYTGGTNLTSGNLTVAANYGLGNPTSTNPNAGLNMNPALSGSVTAFFTSANPHIAALNSGTNGIADVILGNSTANTATTLNIGASGLPSVFNGSILNSGAAVNTAAIGNLVVAGGSLSLNGSDSFTGTTVVAAGTLILGNTNALTGSILNYNNQGGTLSFGSLNAATIGGIEGAENLALSNTSATPIILTIQNSNSAATYSGALTGAGSLVITSSNATQIFSGINTYTGTTTIGASVSGTTTITGAIGTVGSPSGALTQTTTVGTLNVAGGSLYVTSITNDSGSIINVTSNAIVSATGTIAVNANNGTSNGLLSITSGTVTANAVTVGRDGVNQGATIPTAGGTGDGIYINGGTLNVTTTLGVGTPADDNSSANFRMDAGSVTVGGIATVTNSAASRFSTLDINGGVFTDQDTSGVGVQIGGNADGGLLLAELLVRNTGVLNTPAITIGSALQTTGTDIFAAMGGTTNIGSGGIVSGAGGATVVVDLGAGTSSVAPTIAATASWSSSVPMVLANSGNSGPTFLTTSGSNITLTGNLTGGGGLIAKGTGILTLGGVDTYSGATTVTGTGGRLLVSGSVSGTVSVTVNSGANLEVDGVLTSTSAAAISGRLSGTGFINGATVLSSGTLAAGFSTGSTTAGTLTSTGNVLFGSTNGTLSIRLGVTTGAGGDNDQLAMNNGSTLTLDNTTLRLSIGAAEAGASAGSIYDIVSGGFSGTGTGTDVFGNAPASGDSITVGSQVFDVFYGVGAGSTTAPGNDIAVELVSVPEPGTWAEIIAGIGILCIWQRSRRRDRRRMPD